MDYRTLITQLTENDPNGFFFDTGTIYIPLFVNLKELKVDFSQFEEEFITTYFEMFPNRDRQFVLVSTSNGDILVMREW